jgi:hypothetical protein
MMVRENYPVGKSGMSEHDRVPVDDVRVSLAALTERVTEIFLRAETLRALMIERCVFTAAEFDATYRDRQRLWASRHCYTYPGKRDDDQLAQLLHLIESLAVTK